jgi:pimeloyl-ACP methyl ester carboxylesterase
MSHKIAQTAKGPIEYRFEGTGPTILVLNGSHCSRESRLSHEHLSEQGFSVLTPSRPGYDSTPSDVGRTAQEAADAMAALLDTLQIATADVIGMSGSGPTALAFALRHPGRIRKLIIESAVTTVWPEDKKVKRTARLVFGRAERVTWGLIKLVLRLAPMTMMRVMLQAMTTLDAHEVIQRMSLDDLRFAHRLLATSQSGTGFMNDLEHRVDDLSGITAPVLVMHSPYDKSVPLKNAHRVAAEVAMCELFEVPADTHLIWIGSLAHDVWQKRLSFLQS